MVLCCGLKYLYMNITQFTLQYLMQSDNTKQYIMQVTLQYE
jgi:hypothetical protein